MNSFKQYLHLILIFLVFVLLLLLWQGFTGYQQFRQFHQQLSERSVTSTSREIHFLMESMKKNVRLFAEQEQTLLIKLVKQNNSPNSDTAAQLEKKINRYFPHHLAFLLADKTGKIQFNHTEQLVGKTCRSELVSYAKSNFKDNPFFVHPGTQLNSDHFDVLTPVSKKGEIIGVFFISFKLETLRRVLSHGEVVDHHLMLLRSNKPSSTIELKGNAHYLTETKLLPQQLEKRIFYSSKIKNSLWNLVDIPDNSLFNKEYRRLFIHGLTVLSVFLLISGLMLWVLKKEDLKSGKTRGLLMAIDKERRRISMDMHDQVLSELSHITRETNQLSDDAKATENVSALQKNLGQVSNNIRAIINDLHPHFLDNLGLEAAIRDCLQQHLSDNTSPEWHLEIDDDLEHLINNEQRFNLYKIILEIVNNIQKHANCSYFSVTMSHQEKSLTLVIEDDGIGFESSNSHKGLGLHNIETRSRLLDAKISWNKSKKQSGSQFILTMMLNPKKP